MSEKALILPDEDFDVECASYSCDAERVSVWYLVMELES